MVAQPKPTTELPIADLLPGGGFLIEPAASKEIFTAERLNEDQRAFYRSAVDFVEKEVVSKHEALSSDSVKRNWIRTGQAKLNDVMRGEMDIQKLLDNVLIQVARYTNAQIGAIYLFADDQLQMLSSYAYEKRKHMSNKYQLGEGLVGQEALE